MVLPSRRKSQKSGIARAQHRDFPAHRQWIRGHACVVKDCESRQIEAAHFDGPVPFEDMGGKGLKRHDRWCLPACALHHREIHSLGWQSFERKYGISMKAIAEGLAKISPHRWRWEEGR